MVDEAQKDETEEPKVEVFGSMFCPYCTQTKNLLEERGIAYTYKEVLMLFGWKPPLPSYWEMKKRSGGKKTVPQIFINGSHYGDEERLFADDRKGRLPVITGS